jgi:hypothetical protein
VARRSTVLVVASERFSEYSPNDVVYPVTLPGNTLSFLNKEAPGDPESIREVPRRFIDPKGCRMVEITYTKYRPEEGSILCRTRIPAYPLRKFVPGDKVWIGVPAKEGPSWSSYVVMESRTKSLPNKTSKLDKKLEYRLRNQATAFDHINRGFLDDDEKPLAKKGRPEPTSTLEPEPWEELYEPQHRDRKVQVRAKMGKKLRAARH